jgi:hypothetical protein
MVAREPALRVVGVAWFGAVLIGFGLWERYDTTPGGVGDPRASGAPPDARWRLAVFAHPRCPCTRATLCELSELAAAAPELAVRVSFVRPAGSPDGWERGELWDAAARLPGVAVGADADGVEARRMGAETSGQAVLIHPAGRVVFRGGLTPARGRTGASPGRAAVAAWLETEVGPAAAPVYGCPLFTPRD